MGVKFAEKKRYVTLEWPLNLEEDTCDGQAHRAVDWIGEILYCQQPHQ